jgi:hypothetical protein
LINIGLSAKFHLVLLVVEGVVSFFQGGCRVGGILLLASALPKICFIRISYFKAVLECSNLHDDVGLYCHCSCLLHLSCKKASRK